MVQRKIKIHLLIILTTVIIQGCGIYSFTGTNISAETKTYEVRFFQNHAPIIIPGIDLKFTNQLQDLIQNQTNLNHFNSGGDLVYEGEITQYSIAPYSATSQNTAAQNRLTISVNLRFTDIKNPKQDLEHKFTFYYDYPASQSEGAIRDEAIDAIYERITQDIFNATLARW